MTFDQDFRAFKCDTWILVERFYSIVCQTSQLEHDGVHTVEKSPLFQIKNKCLYCMIVRMYWGVGFNLDPLCKCWQAVDT